MSKKLNDIQRYMLKKISNIDEMPNKSEDDLGYLGADLKNAWDE